MFTHRAFSLTDENDYIRFGDFLKNRNRKRCLLIDSDQQFMHEAQKGFVPVEMYKGIRIVSIYEIGFLDDKHVLCYVNLQGMHDKAKELFG